MMENGTRIYKRELSTNDKIFAAAIVFAILLTILKLSAFPVLGVMFFAALLVIIWQLTHQDVVRITPEGKVIVCAEKAFFYINAWPPNTYSTLYWRGKGAAFVFTLANIAKVYKTSKPEPWVTISDHICMCSFDPAMWLARKNEDAVCFEFKNPLQYCDNRGNIKSSVLSLGERLPIPRVYVTVADPEKLIQDIHSRMNPRK